MNKFLVLSLVALLAGTGLMAQGDKAVKVAQDGTVTVNTETLCDATGYADATPVEIKIVKGKITEIKALDNFETPQYFEMAVDVFKEWIGLTPKQGLAAKVDAVSGATYSSKSLIENVRAGLAAVEKK